MTSKESKPTQFGQGRNQPNRKGRPKGSPNIKTVVKEFAEQMHTITRNGQKEEVNTIGLLLHALMQDVLKGNVRAVKMRDKYLMEYCVEQAKQKRPVILVGKRLGAEEWMARQRRKNQELATEMQAVLDEEAQQKPS